MAAEIIGRDGAVVSVRISGRLTQAELAAAQEQMARLIAASGAIRLLVLVENFTGWEQGAAWNDFSFQEAQDANIRRMAIVGEERWRDLVLLFTSKGLRPFPIEFFPPARRAEAQAWLEAGDRRPLPT